MIGWRTNGGDRVQAAAPQRRLIDNVLRLIKQFILQGVRLAGYDILKRSSVDPENAGGDEGAVEGRDAATGDHVTKPVPEVDYQSLMAQQSLMAAFADLDSEALPQIEFVRPYTMTSIERMFDLYMTVRYLVKAGVPGDMLECGVWRGGSMMLVAKTLLAFGDTSRTLYLFDTFEGHPKPDADKDRDLWGHNPLNEWNNFRKTDESSDWANVSIDEVRDNMARTGYPMDKVVLVKGMVERTAAGNAPGPLALVRLDTDWYASAKAGLEAFWPRLSRKGFLIVDDYGHYRGQREAVDAYFSATPVKLNRVDYSCRTIQKVD